MVEKKSLSAERTGFSKERANMTEEQFKAWYEKHGYTGDAKAAYVDICKKAGVAPKNDKGAKNKEAIS